MTVQIRRAVLDDLDAVEALWREMMDFHTAIDDYFTLSPEADRNHRKYMAGLIQDQAKRIFVAEAEGQILGFLMAEINAYPPIFVHPNYGHIGATSVTKTARRKGVGHNLVNAALNWFLEQGVKRVECGVAIENPVSQSFWKTVGFRSLIERCALDIAGQPQSLGDNNDRN